MVLRDMASGSLGQWLYLTIPFALYSLCTLALLAFGRSDEPNPLKAFFLRISNSLERLTGLAGWSMAGVLTGLLALAVAVVGFYWDVAWHIDYGRDEQLFTPAHVMILLGLAGLVQAAVVTVIFATLDRAEAGFESMDVRIPWSAVLLTVMGVGAVAGFPLDELWHEAYGVDVTLWSPTHLQLVTGGSLATIPLWLMTAEALPTSRPNAVGRAIHVLTAAAVLVGLSTFQAEFDYGMPQFQALYLPLLVMAAGALTLVASRVALGTGGALKVAVVYLVLRGLLALLIGGTLNHTVPRFPLYLPSALAVEAAGAVVGTRRRLGFALACGALVGSVGAAGELLWIDLFGWHDASALLSPKVALLGIGAALAAAVLGAGLARVFAAEGRIPPPLLALAAVVLVALLAYPLPRRVGDVSAVVRLGPEGDQSWVEVTLEPPDAAEKATAFLVASWQGGGTVRAALERVGIGRYRSTRPVPTTGSWKSMVTLQRGDQVMAAPIYLPADPEIGASAVPAVPERHVEFVRNTEILLREAHEGPAWPALVAYSGLGLLVALWVGLIAFATTRVPPARSRGGSR